MVSGRPSLSSSVSVPLATPSWSQSAAAPIGVVDPGPVGLRAPLGRTVGDSRPDVKWREKRAASTRRWKRVASLVVPLLAMYLASFAGTLTRIMRVVETPERTEAAGAPALREAA